MSKSGLTKGATIASNKCLNYFANLWMRNEEVVWPFQKPQPPTYLAKVAPDPQLAQLANLRVMESFGFQINMANMTMVQTFLHAGW